MLSVTNKPIMLSVVILSVVTPFYSLAPFKHNAECRFIVTVLKVMAP